MRKILILLFLFTAFAGKIVAQEEFKIMQYNLLYYGLEIFSCDNTNNNTTDKNNNLEIILGYAQPDILCVNELGKSNANADNLLNNALNSYGSKTYARATLTGNSSITNMIFYNTEKFILTGQETTYSYPRSINIYKFRYTEAAYGGTNPPEFTVISAHLKAGNNNDDEQDRRNSINNVMARIDQLGAGNYFFTGDLNMYSSSDAGFQKMTNYSNATLNFYDPINQLGSWSNNSAYTNYHTQSSHYSGSCAVGGGLDDRFDFVMISADVKNGTKKLSYKPGSYETIGQDGDHFNSSVNWGGNNAVSTTIASALYEMSDHLPVIMTVAVANPNVNINKINTLTIKYNNPVTKALNLEIKNGNKQNFEIKIYSISGQLVLQTRVKTNTAAVQMQSLAKGIYFMQLSNGQSVKTIKIVKQ